MLGCARKAWEKCPSSSCLRSHRWNVLSPGSCQASLAAHHLVLLTAPLGSERLSACPSLLPGWPRTPRAGPSRGLQRDAQALVEVTQSPAKINPGLPMSKIPGHYQTWSGGTCAPSMEALGVNLAPACHKGGAGVPSGQG